MSKGIFFGFNASSGTLHNNTCTCYCCWRHKFATQTLLCNSQYLELRVAHQRTNKVHCCFFTATMVKRKRDNATLHVHCHLIQILKCLYIVHLLVIWTCSNQIRRTRKETEYIEGFGIVLIEQATVSREMLCPY
jgi:hypothetical protein